MHDMCSNRGQQAPDYTSRQYIALVVADMALARRNRFLLEKNLDGRLNLGSRRRGVLHIDDPELAGARRRLGRAVPTEGIAAQGVLMALA